MEKWTSHLTLNTCVTPEGLTPQATISFKSTSEELPDGHTEGAQKRLQQIRTILQGSPEEPGPSKDPVILTDFLRTSLSTWVVLFFLEEFAGLRRMKYPGGRASAGEFFKHHFDIDSARARNPVLCSKALDNLHGLPRTDLKSERHSDTLEQAAFLGILLESRYVRQQETNNDAFEHLSKYLSYWEHRLKPIDKASWVGDLDSMDLLKSRNCECIVHDDTVSITARGQRVPRDFPLHRSFRSLVGTLVCAPREKWDVKDLTRPKDSLYCRVA